MPSFLRRTPRTGPSGLVGRGTFYDRVDELRTQEEDSGLGVSYLGLSHLKYYNLRAGLDAADAVVEGITSLLTRHAGDRGIIAQDSPVSFLLVVRESHLEELVSQLNAYLAEHDDTCGLEIEAGFCSFREGCDARGTVDRARYAYEEIRYSDGQYLRIFDDELCHTFDRQRYVIDSLDDAIERGEIRAYAQPIVRILTGRVCEVEILARWESERFGLIQPGDFIPQLERFRLIHKLDATVVRLACALWREAEERGVAVPFGINLSRLDFELCDIFQVVCDAMSVYDVPVDIVHVEVTESATSGDEDLLRAGVARFREAGFKVYLDDFGTGYSSLDSLLGDTYDVVKLDMGLISDIEVNERSRVVVAETVSMAKRLGMQTLCEGVENLEQLRFLRMVGCEKAQGYFFGKPVEHGGVLRRLAEEAERCEEAGFTQYLDAVGHVNLIDGTRSTVEGVEAAVFLGDVPVAIAETWGNHIYCLSANAAFDRFVRRVGLNSFEEAVGKISAGNAEMRTRLLMAADRAKMTGGRETVDFVLGGIFSIISIEHIAETAERDAYLVRASSVTESEDMARERSLEAAAPFIYSIYKRIDLFDLETGTSTNIYLNAPLLRSQRMAGIIISEIREFCDRNIHPADRARFMEFYDLSSLEQRVTEHGAQHDVAVLRTRVPEGGYADHLYTLIPMQVHGHRQVLSTLRAIDVGLSGSYQVSGSERISDATLLDAVLEGTDRYVFWKDDQRRFLGANQAFLDYYGFDSIDEILGKTDDEVGWHQDNKPFRDDELRVLSGEVVLRARGTCYDRNELRYIEANKRPIVVSGEIVGLLGYFRDMGPAEEERRPGA